MGCSGDDDTDPLATPTAGMTAGLSGTASDDDDSDTGEDRGEDRGEDNEDGTAEGGQDDDTDGPAPDTGADTGDSDGDDSGPMIPDGPWGACAEAVPAGSPTPPAAPPYSGGTCPAIAPGYVTNFVAGGNNREFAFVVPSNYDESKQYPLVIAWYHLSGDAQEFLDTIGAQALADTTQTIYAVPQATGNFDFVWPSTPLDNGQASVDLAMFDDMLACISEQYSVNPYCVGSVGVSAGGLWTSYLGQQRGQYLSSNVVISGGHPADIGWWGWSPSPHKFASLVLWGGPTDELIINFHAASTNLASEYAGDGHFVLRCEHTGGHGVPPPDVPGDPPPFDVLFEFFLAHPYWVDNGNSPYLTEGLPPEYPSYCAL
ncbi:MAG: hypothetical protein JKY37_05645 [Nannocystaceae bacterium]|nr:hypothetical protein [Nannocystaceae bacterium]